MSDLVKELRMVAERLFYESHPRDEQSIKDYNTVQRAASALEGRAVTDGRMEVLWRALVPLARQADFYKPDVPHYEQVPVPLDMLRRARAAIPGPLPPIEEILDGTFATPEHALAMQPPQPTTGTE